MLSTDRAPDWEPCPASDEPFGDSEPPPVLQPLTMSTSAAAAANTPPI